MIFITGPHNSGKTSLAKFLAKHGFIFVETGEIVRKKHKELAPETDFLQWVKCFGSKFDEYILEEVLKAKKVVETHRNGLIDIVVVGNRQISGISFIEEKVNPLPRAKHIIVYIEAEPRLLYERQKERQDRVIDGLTYDCFVKKVLGFDEAMGLLEIKNYADLIITAEGTKEEVARTMTEFLLRRGYEIRGFMNSTEGRRRREISI